jgi:hypothetical protein
MANIHGYRVVTTEGKTVGRVAGESDRALVVEGGTWPWRAWRAVPKASASVNPDERRVVNVTAARPVPSSHSHATATASSSK